MTKSKYKFVAACYCSRVRLDETHVLLLIFFYLFSLVPLKTIQLLFTRGNRAGKYNSSNIYNAHEVFISLAVLTKTADVANT